MLVLAAPRRRPSTAPPRAPRARRPSGPRPTRTASGPRRPAQPHLADARRRPPHRGLLPRPRARRRCATCSSSCPTGAPSRSASRTRPTQRVRLLDSRSLSYRQVNTDRDGLYRIVKTYTTDPARSSVLVHVEFRALTRRQLSLYVLHDPALSNNGDDDSGASRAGGLVAWDDSAASALLTDARFRRTSSGFLGRSDGWTDLSGRPPHEPRPRDRARRQRRPDRAHEPERQAPHGDDARARLRRRSPARRSTRRAPRSSAASTAPRARTTAAGTTTSTASSRVPRARAPTARPTGCRRWCSPRARTS